MEKIRMTSRDVAAANIEALAELFPNVVTETTDAEGGIQRSVDFDLLRQELSDHIVEGPQERYQLDWPGKRAAAFAANAPIAKTLRPFREESVDFDTTKNLFIEGDNLDALKLLQESYLGKVKLIYIDPPYNTGNDFVYADAFAASTAEYLVKSEQVSEAGERLVANSESNGRFHSDWLSMMYSRLKLARNLLTDDGVIAVSIDDGESASLKLLMDQVFGAPNFVATIVWQKRYVSNVTARHISDMHDFIHVYARNAEHVSVGRWSLTEEQLKAYKNPDNDHRGRWRAQDLSASKPYQAGKFPIEHNGQVFTPPPNRYWRCNREQFESWDRDGRIWWGVDGTARPMLKSYLNEKDATTTPHTWWDYSFAGHNKAATLEVKSLFDGSAPFDTPKPVKLMERLIELFASKDATVLDFFSGSGSTAHAVMNLNSEDGGKRRFILVQLPEELDAAAQQQGYATIADVARERLRRVGVQLNGSDADPSAGHQDRGFRSLKIDTTSKTDTLRSADVLQQLDIEQLEPSVKPDRTGEDLLFQAMLEAGLELSLPISREERDGLEIYDVEQGALLMCIGNRKLKTRGGGAFSSPSFNARRTAAATCGLPRRGVRA